MGSYQIFEGPLEALTALALLAACVAVAYPLAALVTERHRLSHRWCATAIIASWLLTLLFYALASIAAFRLPVVLSICLLLAGGLQIAIARRPGIRSLFGSDMRKAIEHVRQPPGLLLSVAGLAVVAVFGVRILKGLVAPPLAWDSLTYHLVKAGRWVQQGGWSPDAAPDAWSYYEYFPPGGDLLWAWVMLPGHSDALIGLAGGLVWLVCLLATYGAARALDAPRKAALGTALAVVAMPCVLSFVTSAYVTSLVLTDLLLALTFILLVLESGRVSDAVLAATALGLAASVQTLALPLLVFGLGVVVVALWWHHGSSTTWRAGALCLVACVPMLTGYFLAWVRTGSPLYPFALTIGGKTVLAGNEELARVFSGENLNQPFQFALSTFAWDLFHRPALIDHLNFGAGAVALVVLGLVGLWPMLRDGRRRVAAVLLLTVVVISVAGIMPDSMLSQRTSFAPVAGRFIVPALAALALIGSLLPGRAAAWMRALAILGGAAYAMPQTISDVELTAMTRLTPYLAGGVAIAIILGGIGWRVRRTSYGLAAGTLAGILVISIGVYSTRAIFRYPIYRATAESTPAPYDLIPLFPFVVAWQIWSDLDREKPFRIAYAVGWDNFNGHTAFRYPLLGSRLQNMVLYVRMCHPRAMARSSTTENATGSWPNSIFAPGSAVSSSNASRS